ncbi:MAG TPA: hypothetical protein DCL77_11165, partial [Prolixibacteraceae bacterium]|nr:hypothetical protein [Prolixibacteraceae bacterium]
MQITRKTDQCGIEKKMQARLFTSKQFHYTHIKALIILPLPAKRLYSTLFLTINAIPLLYLRP